MDEIGKYQEKDRELLNSLRASLAAKHGRFIALSIWGDGPHVPEFVARRDHEGVSVHLYQPALDSKIGDEEAWHQGNPSLRAGVKNLSHMRAALKRVQSSVGDQSFFRAEEMNLPGSSSKELIVTVEDWRRCTVSRLELPPREGRAWLGLDCGGSSSITAACCIFENGRAEFFAALPATPSLEDRGATEGCGSLYKQAWDRQSSLPSQDALPPSLILSGPWLQSYLASRLRPARPTGFGRPRSSRFLRTRKRVSNLNGSSCQWAVARGGAPTFEPSKNWCWRPISRRCLTCYSRMAYPPQSSEETAIQTPAWSVRARAGSILSRLRSWRLAFGRLRAATAGSQSSGGQ